MSTDSRRAWRSAATPRPAFEAVLDAAVSVVRDLGPDDLNLSAVARAASVTTGAVYSRYENRQEILLDVWDKRASIAVREVIDLGVRISAGDASAVPQALERLRARDRRLMAGLALLIVAPRIDELDESLLPQVREWMAEADPERKALILIAFLLGAASFDAAAPGEPRDWAPPLEWVCGYALPAPTRREAGVPQPSDELRELVPVDTGDGTRDDLLRSMAVIVAKSGFVRATTSRIARAMGYPQSAIFDYWPTRAELTAEFTEYCLKGMVQTTSPLGVSALTGDADGAGKALARILSPAYHRTRRLRLETVLGAMSDAKIAEVVHRFDERAVKSMTEALGAQAPPTIGLLAETVRATVLGMVLLQETVGECDELEFAGPISGLLRALPSA